MESETVWATSDDTLLSLTVPVDQRYTAEDFDRITAIIKHYAREPVE
jgi:hypothetical protein